MPWDSQWELYVEASEPDVLAFKLPQQVFTVLGVKSGKIVDYGSGQAVLVYGWDKDKGGVKRSVVSFATGVCDSEVGPFAITYANNTEPGWSGSPLFNQKGAIVGLHKGAKEDVNRNVGVSLFWLPRLLRSLDNHIKLESDITQKGYKLAFLTNEKWNEDREERRQRQLDRRSDVEAENEREFEFGVRIGNHPYFMAQSLRSQQVMYTEVDINEWERKKYESGESLWADIDEESAAPMSTSTQVETSPTVVVPDFRKTQTGGSLSQLSEPQVPFRSKSSENFDPTQKERESLLLELATRSEQNIKLLREQIQVLQLELMSLKNSKPLAGPQEEETMKKSVSFSKAADSSKEKSQPKIKSTAPSQPLVSTTPKPKSQAGPKVSVKKE